MLLRVGLRHGTARAGVDRSAAWRITTIFASVNRLFFICLPHHQEDLPEQVNKLINEIIAELMRRPSVDVSAISP